MTAATQYATDGLQVAENCRQIPDFIGKRNMFWGRGCHLHCFPNQHTFSNLAQGPPPSIFRMRLTDALDLSDLSLPRTFFGRSEINQVSFRNCDLHESNLCWNDFLAVDFTGADLSYSDMRSSIFKGVRFAASNLEGADLRRSSFVDCVFEDAAMKGVALTHQQGATMRLSQPQRNEDRLAR